MPRNPYRGEEWDNEYPDDDFFDGDFDDFDEPDTQSDFDRAAEYPGDSEPDYETPLLRRNL